MTAGGAGRGGEGILVLGAGEVGELLAGREAEVLAAVREAYLVHGRGRSSLPHSTLLRFPGDEVNRIIGLPAYLGDGFEVSGIKWIASYPGNVGRGLPRASAVVVLNSTETGRPTAILEGSIISARRTAASAALAAQALASEPPEVAGLVGTGLINHEIARFLRSVFPGLRRFALYDLDGERARAFGEKLQGELEGLSFEVAPSTREVLNRCSLVAFATTAVHPHVPDLDACPHGATVLHVSLRDLAPEAVLAADNVVDDREHVLRAGTSLHLALERAASTGPSGAAELIRATLAEVLEGGPWSERRRAPVTVFSPFGLGVLDLAVAQRVHRLAREVGTGTEIRGFLPG